MYIKERKWEIIVQIAGKWLVVNAVTKFCVFYTVHVLVINILSTYALRGKTHLTHINCIMFRHRDFNNKLFCILRIKLFNCGYKNEQNIFRQVGLYTFVLVTPC